MTGANAPFRIFINYRRDDSAGHVGRLSDVLRSGVEGQPGFSKEQIFMDIDAIEPGVDFREAIRKAVEASDVFLTVIGKQWLTAADSSGRRRLDHPADFVRLEIEAALERAARHHDVRVVPTRVQGADMPGAEDLPTSIAELAHRHAVELTDERWHYDVGRLFTSLKKLEREKLERSKAAEEPLHPEPPDKTSPEEERRIRIGKPAVAAAIVVALAAIAALAIVLFRDGDEPPNGTPPAPPPGSGALVWERVSEAALGGEGDQALSSIVAISGVYLAGGFDTSAGSRDAAVWTSSDGRISRAPAGEAFERAGDQEITSIAPFEREPTAVGTDDSNGDDDVAVWTSPDGLQWDLAAVLREPGTGDRINRVNTSRTFGLVGGGWRTGDDDDAAVWIFPTADAIPGTRPVADPDFGGPGDQRITRVLEHERRLVAVGSADGDAAAWTSDDGEEWKRAKVADPLGGDGEEEMLDAERFESTLVAVGRDGERGAVWLSNDGQSWTRVPDPEDVFAGSDSVRLNRVYNANLRSSGARLVAGGSAGDDAAVWVSNDRRQWAREPAHAFGGEGDQTVMSFRKQEGGVIAVGWSESEDGLDAAVWFGAGAE